RPSRSRSRANTSPWARPYRRPGRSAAPSRSGRWRSPHASNPIPGRSSATSIGSACSWRKHRLCRQTVAMTFAALQPLADRASFFAALRQDALTTAVDALGEHRWHADLAAGTLTFSATASPAQRIVPRPHLVATSAPGPRSLLWAWAHPQGDPQGIAAQLRDYGAQYEIAELSQAEVPSPDDAGTDLDEW